MERSRGCWKRTGAVPPTREALNSKHIRRELGDGDDATHGMLQMMQAESTLACDAPAIRGHQPDALRIFLREREDPKPVPSKDPNKKNSEKTPIETKVAAGKRAGDMFPAAIGHLASEDFFRIQEHNRNSVKAREMEKDKARRLEPAEAERKALAAPGRTEGSLDRMFVGEPKDMLKWCGEEPKRLREGPALLMSKTVREENRAPVQCVPWTKEDDERLATLQDANEVALEDTRLHRHQKNEEADLRATLHRMTDAEVAAMIEERSRALGECKDEEEGQEVIDVDDPSEGH